VAGDQDSDIAPLPGSLSGTIRDYPEFLQALRNRATQIVATNPTDPLLCRLVAPIKRIRMDALGDICRLLGVQVVMIEDKGALERMRSRVSPSKQQIHSGAVLVSIPRASLCKWGAIGGRKSRSYMTRAKARELARRAAAARIASQSAERRIASARHAIATRWQRVREARNVDAAS
jgi:hypothetical protein